MVTAVECLLPGLHIQLRDCKAQLVLVFLYELFTVINLASNEEYGVSYVLTLTCIVQYFTQVVVELSTDHRTAQQHVQKYVMEEVTQKNKRRDK